MRRPYNPKRDPVIISTSIGIVLLVFGLATWIDASSVRLLRMRIQHAYGGQLVHLDTMWSDGDAHAICGLYSTPPSQKQWRYLDGSDVTWAEGRMPPDAKLSDFLRGYNECMAYRSYSRGGTGAVFSPLKLAIANRR
jgi:hypothetical protein